ncbi:MAG: hypothetical protein N2234_00810 [Planctomycetota bacterium]|nr:hypothetical protein [Planctomycetota bacterium]
MSRFSLLSVLLVLLFFCGCASMGQYFADRGNDLLDVFGLNFSYGAGLLLNVRATQFVQVGMVGFSGARVGFCGRHCFLWGEESIELGIAPFLYGRFLSLNPLSSGMPEVEDVLRGQSLIVTIYRDDYEKSFDEAYDRRLFDFGVTFHFFLIGFEAFFNPVEAIDFVLGLFTTVDISGDDGEKKSEEKGRKKGKMREGGEPTKEMETDGKRDGK